MLIPYSTDAPIYHFPFCTIGVILVNIIVFAVSVTGLPASLPLVVDGAPTERMEELPPLAPAAETIDPAERQQALVLQFDRIAPWQWITNTFMHADIMHLLGNMLFLWAFGLIVEGKVGWLRFLAIYLGIATVYSAIVQLGMYVFSSSDGVALGASGVIFGVMAIAVAWAPKNEISCFTWFFYPRIYEIPLLIFGFAYFALQFFFLSVQGFRMSSELLHLVGILVGLPVGLFMVKRGLVDCEGWDLFNVLADNVGWKPVSREAVVETDQQSRLERQQRERVTTLRSVDDALEAGRPEVAEAILAKQAKLFSREDPIPHRVLIQLVRNRHAKQQWAESIPWMEWMIKQSASPQPAVALKLAQILYQVSKRPKYALRLLSSLPDDLTPKQAELRKKLVERCQAALTQDADDFELEED